MRFAIQPRAGLAAVGVISTVLGVFCVSLARVQAADAPPAVVSMTALLAQELPLNPITGNRVKAVYVGDAGSIAAIQIGDLKPHTHEMASEMFYVVEGSGQMTVGDAKQPLKAGDLMIVPKGVLHSIKSDSGLLKAILITMPPRAADDVHFAK
jgi:mannose-6-phosphate isomerase-like protein (cupin superfamily)